MFKILKIGFWVLIGLIVIFLWWFLPKYDFVHNNPQYCVNLTQHLYYCGAESHLEQFFNLAK